MKKRSAPLDDRGDTGRLWRRDRDRGSAGWRRKGLTFLLGVSQVDPEIVLKGDRRGDLLNICAGLSILGSREGSASNEKEADWLAGVFRDHPKIFKTLVEQLQSMFADVADGKEFRMDLHKAVMRFDAGALKTGRYPFSVVVFPGTEDGLVQAILHGAIVLLSQGPEGAMVQRCKRCERVFLGTRMDQEYCSRRCVNAANFERYKERLGVEGSRSKRSKSGASKQAGRGSVSVR